MITAKDDDFKRNYKKWWRDIKKWLYDGRRLFYSLAALIFIPIVFIFFWHFIINEETSVKIAGALLQVVGISFALYELVRVRAKIFNHKKLRLWFCNWMKSIPLLPKKTANASYSALGVIKAGTKLEAFGSVPWKDFDDQMSSKQQIEAIINNLLFLKNNYESVDRRFKELKSIYVKDKKKISESLSSLEKAHKDDEKKLEDAFLENIAFSLTGLIMIIEGILIYTFSTQIFSVLAYIL